MLSETKKIVLVISMTLISLIIEAIVHIDYLLSKDLKTVFISEMIHSTGISLWGWLPAILLTVSSIGLTIYWRPANIIFRIFLIFISFIIAIIAVIWAIGLYIISQPGLWA